MSKLALPVAGFAFCTWAVYLGGLAGVQDWCEQSKCGGLNACKCSEEWRYWWFVMAIELVVVLAVIAATFMNKLSNARIALVALVAVCTLLYMEASNYFLTQVDVIEDRVGTSAGRLPRFRTAAAGAIMTATANCFLILALGVVGDGGEAAVVVEKASAV